MQFWESPRQDKRPATSGVGEDLEESEFQRLDDSADFIGAEEQQFASLSDQLPAAKRADFPIPRAQIPTFQSPRGLQTGARES